MFCYQCQETGNGKGCMGVGVCGKTDETANLQDLLIWLLKGLAFLEPLMADKRAAGKLAAECLFATVTNTNFDPQRIIGYAKRVRALSAALLAADPAFGPLHESAAWAPQDDRDFYRKSLDANVSVMRTADADIRSLREITVYALKGMAAYAYHAAVLDHYDDDIFAFIFRALRATVIETDKDALAALAIETGKYTLAAMDVLDRANTAVYGMPSPRRVPTGAHNRPGILVSGHELKDLENLLEQTKDAGIDVYTNGEMILAQSLPFFRKYPHLAGNYGNAWWQQVTEFARFNGAILVTSNCIVPPDPAYANRLFTTSIAGYPGIPHIDGPEGKKDFSALIARAQRCPPPEDLREPNIWHGFGHGYLSSVKDTVVGLVKQGKIRQFIVMAGCDGRDLRRRHYTEKAAALPPDTIILTAGCAKYRYIKKVTGDIEGIPRVLDAGQCSDSYSLIAFAHELADTLGADINDLPVEYDIAWYDQKAVAIFLTLLHLGIRTIRLGPTLPEYFQQYLAQHLPPGTRVDTVHRD